MKNTSAKLIFLFNVVFTCSIFGQERSSEQSQEWTPSYGFPSVAVVKLDDKNVLQILLPSATVPVPNGATIEVTEEYPAEENGIQVLKTRTVSRPAAYLPDKFRMVRTQLSIDKMKLRDQSGKVLDVDEISKSIRNPTYVILVQGGSISPSRQHYFREGSLVLSPEDLDPNCWYLPEVAGLAQKWTRTEPLPKPAIAQLVENGTKIEIVFIKMEYSTEVRTRNVKLADGSEVEQTYEVSVPIYSNARELIDVNECVFSGADGKEVATRTVLERLSQPCHILWESTITDFLGSVLKPDLILVNRKPKVPN